MADNPTNHGSRPDPWEVERLSRLALGDGDHKALRQVRPTDEGVRVELSSWDGREQVMEALYRAGYEARRDSRSVHDQALMVSAAPADPFVRLNPEFARVTRGLPADRQRQVIQVWERAQSLSGRVTGREWQENSGSRAQRQEVVARRAREHETQRPTRGVHVRRPRERYRVARSRRRTREHERERD
jgi:hypothetical protein